MENLGAIIKAAQSVGSKELAVHGTRQLPRDSVIHLATMLRQMGAAFPHQEYAEETTEIFLLMFEDLALKYGLNELETALRSFLTKQKFFPHPAEVAGVLEEMANKAKQEAKKSLPKIGCPKCHDGGWAPGHILTVDEKGDRFVKECECLLEYRAARKAMDAA
jgi:hypothetical protein